MEIRVCIFKDVEPSPIMHSSHWVGEDQKRNVIFLPATPAWLGTILQPEFVGISALLFFFFFCWVSTGEVRCHEDRVMFKDEQSVKQNE